MSLVRAEGLRAYYITNAYGVRRVVKAVDNVTLEVRENEILGIAGESGCGKSTLMKTLLGIVEPPLSVVGGRVVYTVSGRELDVVRTPQEVLDEVRWSHVSYIPQGSMNVLNPVRRIKHIFRDFIAHRGKRMSPAELLDWATRHLKLLGLPSEVLEAYPHQLSGGMKQRVTIALATILKPRVVFADEPTTALDVIVQRGVIQLLSRIQAEEKNSLVLVTHDMAVHAHLAHRIAIMYAGKVIEEGSTAEIFRAPQHPYTQYLIGSLPRIGSKGYRTSAPGNPPRLDRPLSGCRFQDRCPKAMPQCKDASPALVQSGDDHKVACFLVSPKEEKESA